MEDNRTGLMSLPLHKIHKQVYNESKSPLRINDSRVEKGKKTEHIMESKYERGSKSPIGSRSNSRAVNVLNDANENIITSKRGSMQANNFFPEFQRIDINKRDSNVDNNMFTLNPQNRYEYQTPILQNYSPNKDQSDSTYYRQLNERKISRKLSQTKNQSSNMKDVLSHSQEWTIPPERMRTPSKSPQRAEYIGPYDDGMRNRKFSNPSLTSSAVFYNHNYGYINDMPNPRMLSQVKNDKFSRGSFIPNQTDMSNSEIYEQAADKNKHIRSKSVFHMRSPLKDESQQEFRYQQNDISPRELPREQTPISPRPDQTLEEPKRHKSFSDLKKITKDLRIVAPKTPQSQAGRNGEENFEEIKASIPRGEIDLTTTPTAAEKVKNNESSRTPVNKNSTPTRYSENKQKQDIQKLSERRHSEYNMRPAKKTEENLEFEKNRISDAHEMKKMLEEKYQEKSSRSSLSKYCENGPPVQFKNIFDHQDEIIKKKKALSENLKGGLLNQILKKNQHHEKEKRETKRVEQVSLNFTDDYKNKYIPSSIEYRETLVSQMKEKTRKEIETKSVTKICLFYQQHEKALMREVLERVAQLEVEDESYNKSRIILNKSILKEEYDRELNEKAKLKAEEKAQKMKERTQGYNYFKDLKKQEENRTRSRQELIEL